MQKAFITIPMVICFPCFFFMFIKTTVRCFTSRWKKNYTEDSDNSMSDVNALIDNFVRMQFESSSSGEEITNDNVDLGHLKRTLADNIVEAKEGAGHIV